MLEFVDLTDWKTKKEILEELKTLGFKYDERALRKYIEQYNKRFCDGEFEHYIAHSSKGYKLTNNPDEIEKSAKDLHRRAMDMLVKTSEARKAVQRLNQEKLF